MALIAWRCDNVMMMVLDDAGLSGPCIAIASSVRFPGSSIDGLNDTGRKGRTTTAGRKILWQR